VIDRDAERQRIGATVERFLDECEEQEAERLDTFMIVGLIVRPNEDGDDEEAPTVVSETRRPHVRIGMLNMALWMHQSDYVGGAFE
jgi:hypothetical protein